MNKCDKCPAWLDIVMKDALFDEVVQWQQWERVSHPVQSKQGKSKVVKKMEKVIKEGTVEEALHCLQHKIPSFLEHVFVKRKQAAFFDIYFDNIFPELVYPHILHRESRWNKDLQFPRVT